MNDTEAVGEKDFPVCFHKAIAVKNQMRRTYGYSPAQWVRGKNPRMLSGVTHLDEAGNLGVREDSLDPSARLIRTIQPQ